LICSFTRRGERRSEVIVLMVIVGLHHIENESLGGVLMVCRSLEREKGLVRKP